MFQGVIPLTIPIAVAMMSRFLMMYCPSSVGINQFCQAICGSRNKGPAVVMRCKTKIAMTRRES